MRRLPIRRASSACPSALLILCAPVCVRSSRFSRDPHAGRAARLGRQPPRLVERRRTSDVGGEQRRRARAGSARRRAPPGSRRSAPRSARPASRGRTARRTRRSSRARPDRAARTPVSASSAVFPTCPTCPTVRGAVLQTRRYECRARVLRESATPCPDSSGRARPRRPTTHPRRTACTRRNRLGHVVRRQPTGQHRPAAAAQSPPPAANPRACPCRRARPPDTASSSSVAVGHALERHVHAGGAQQRHLQRRRVASPARRRAAARCGCPCAPPIADDLLERRVRRTRRRPARRPAPPRRCRAPGRR